MKYEKHEINWDKASVKISLQGFHDNSIHGTLAIVKQTYIKNSILRHRHRFVDRIARTSRQPVFLLKFRSDLKPSSQNDNSREQDKYITRRRRSRRATLEAEPSLIDPAKVDLNDSLR